LPEMNKLYLKKRKAATLSQSFCDASAEELRVLVALIEYEGEDVSPRALAKLASVSDARAAAATALWQAEGVFETAREKSDSDNVTDEFAERFSAAIHEESSLLTAKTVRDGELAALLSECATLMDKPALTTEEVKKITSIYSQLSLSEEYIFTLAAHIAEKKKLTATLLAKEADRLVSLGVDTIEALGLYIEDSSRESGADKEFRRVFGIWNRTLSKSEKEYFQKWSEEYGFSTEIVGEAYSIMTTNRSGSGISLPYIDSILKRWHECGCTTEAACRAQSEADKKGLADKKTGHGGRKKEEKKPKFIEFDVEDAFKRALERSYGSDKNDN